MIISQIENVSIQLEDSILTELTKATRPQPFMTRPLANALSQTVSTTPSADNMENDWSHVEQRRLRRAIGTMIAKGWCNHQVQYLAQKLALDAFIFVASLDRHPLRLTDHTVCSGKSWCVAYNVDMHNYKSRHISDVCSCAMLAVPYDELVKIIRQGAVPLVTIEETPGLGGQLSLRLHRRQRGSVYTAISHVWADGLGNPFENAVPRCQLRRLKSKLDQLEISSSVSHNQCRQNS